MRNYKRYWMVRFMVQFSPDGGANWFDSGISMQIGRTESEMEDALALDQSYLDPTQYRYEPIVRLGPVYWLLDSDTLLQLAFRDGSGWQTLEKPPLARWQLPPSPRKSWSNGK